ncbi:hypothetical protein WG66_001984 [Moniliophthora roreri]|nr:hypothetical protein WG66_001984 [Moniliophthora roreri]
MLGTWTAATYRSNRQDKISVLFDFQVVNDLGRSGLTTVTGNFMLDGQLARQYIHNPSSQAGFQYREEAFAVSGLSNSSYLLETSAGGLDHKVLDSGPNLVRSSSKTPVAAIVGGTVGTAAFLIAIIAAFCICRRKGQRPQPIPVTPLATENSQIYPTFTARPPDPRRLHTPLSHSTLETRLSYPSTTQNQSSFTGSSQLSEKPRSQQSSEVEHVELNRHAHNMREELRSLTSRTWSSSSVAGSNPNATVQELREEIRLMQAQLDSIRQQQVPSYSS